MVHFGEFLKTWTFCQTELPDITLLLEKKVNKNGKIRMRHFGWFLNAESDNV